MRIGFAFAGPVQNELLEDLPEGEAVLVGAEGLAWKSALDRAGILIAGTLGAQLEGVPDIAREDCLPGVEALEALEARSFLGLEVLELAGVPLEALEELIEGALEGGFEGIFLVPVTEPEGAEMLTEVERISKASASWWDGSEDGY